jgi:hypothetical protein
VPVLYTVLRRKPPALGAGDDEEEIASAPPAGRPFDRADHAGTDDSGDGMLVGVGDGRASDSVSEVEY